MERKTMKMEKKWKEKIINKEQLNRQETRKERKYKRIRQPISWQNSEGIYHSFDSEITGQKEKMTGLHEGIGISGEKRMKEMFRLENSYGNIAIGSNKKKEAMIVVSQKREHNEKSTNRNQKELQMEQAKRKVSPKGEFLVNPGGEKEGATVYRVDVRMTEEKIIPQLKGFVNQEDNIMLEKRMPFLSSDRDKEEKKELGEQIREHREKDERMTADKLEKEKEYLQTMIQQKEEQERMTKRKIKFAWKKMQKTIHSDMEPIRRARRKEKIKIGNLEEETENITPYEEKQNPNS